MCRLWYVFVFIFATIIGPAGVWRRPTSPTHSIGLDSRLLCLLRGGTVALLLWDDRLPSSVRLGLWNDTSGRTANDFGQINRYVPLPGATYLLFGGLGATAGRFKDFRNIVRG
jgi:hypothetical protein